MKISVAGKEIILRDHGEIGFGGDLSSLATWPSDPFHGTTGGENALHKWWYGRQHGWESIGELTRRIAPIDPVAAIKITAWAVRCAEKAGVKI